MAVHPAGHHVLQRGKIEKGFDQLEGARDAFLADPVTRQAGDVLAPERDRAGIGFEESGDQVQRGRLAGAVGADEADDLAFFYVKPHITDGHQSAEGLVEPFDLQDRHIPSPLGIVPVFTAVRSASGRTWRDYPPDMGGKKHSRQSADKLVQLDLNAIDRHQSNVVQIQPQLEGDFLTVVGRSSVSA